MRSSTDENDSAIAVLILSSKYFLLKKKQKQKPQLLTASKSKISNVVTNWKGSVWEARKGTLWQGLFP